MRVLLVEDEVALAEAIRDGLVAEGYDVDAVHDGLDGLWRAREGSYDAIVLDILLPGMNGYKVCQTLREEEVWTPILMLTAKDGEYDEADAFDLGADDYLTKPFSLRELEARVKVLLRRAALPSGAQAADESWLEAGPLRLAPRRYRAFVSERELPLTVTEFHMLAALARRPGHVRTRQQLMSEGYTSSARSGPQLPVMTVSAFAARIFAI